MKKLISFFTIFNVMGTRKMYPRFFYKISNKGKKEYKFLYRINYIIIIKMWVHEIGGQKYYLYISVYFFSLFSVCSIYLHLILFIINTFSYFVL